MGALGALGSLSNNSILFKLLPILVSELYTGVGVTEKSYANAASTSKQNASKSASGSLTLEYETSLVISVLNEANLVEIVCNLVLTSM